MFSFAPELKCSLTLLCHSPENRIKATECIYYAVHVRIAVTRKPKNCFKQLLSAAKHPSPADKLNSVIDPLYFHLSVNTLATLVGWHKVKYAGHALLILTQGAQKR